MLLPQMKAVAASRNRKYHITNALLHKLPLKPPKVMRNRSTNAAIADGKAVAARLNRKYRL
jgi:hypothetical protein